jgi:hypothetical protein
MRISVFCLTLNLVLAALLVGRLKQGGLALANTITATINMALLFYALRKKLASRTEGRSGTCPPCCVPLAAGRPGGRPDGRAILAMALAASHR